MGKVRRTLLAFHHPRFAELARRIYATFYAEIGSLVRSTPTLATTRCRRGRVITAMLDGVAMQVHTARATTPPART